MNENTTVQKRRMLKSYDSQLLMARRLTRLRIKMRLAEGLTPEDPDPAIKRQDYVKVVARELFETMVFTGNENPVVEDIRQELSQALHKEVEFTYPPGGRLCIVALEPEGPRALTPQEQQAARLYLETITEREVHKTMHGRAGVCC